LSWERVVIEQPQRCGVLSHPLCPAGHLPARREIGGLITARPATPTGKAEATSISLREDVGAGRGGSTRLPTSSAISAASYRETCVGARTAGLGKERSRVLRRQRPYSALARMSVSG
jgi:hypothetical protein